MAVELPPLPLMLAVVTAVIKPLPFTVMTGVAVELPNVPGVLLTVASVLTVLPAVLVTSPVYAGIFAAGIVLSPPKTPPLLYWTCPFDPPGDVALPPVPQAAPASPISPAAVHCAQWPEAPAAAADTVLLPVPVKESVACLPLSWV